MRILHLARIVGFVAVVLGSPLMGMATSEKSTSRGDYEFMYQFPGPNPVGMVEFDVGRVDVNRPGGSGTISVRHYGVIFYPAEMDGSDVPLHGGGPFPLIVFGHGRYQVQPQVGSNHEQATYLMRHLASHGYIAASVNLDVVGQYAVPAAIPQRGELIHRTIDLLEEYHNDSDSLFASGVDLSRIGLAGHSRGGEGVVAAAVNNDAGRNILGVFTIAPTDFQLYSLTDTPYYSIYGARDGDVNNGWPIMLYDRAEPLKGFLFVYGASHFHFTQSILFDAADMPRRAHHIIARTLATAFMKLNLDGDDQVLQFLSFDESIPRTGHRVIRHYPLFEHPERLVVDDYENIPRDVHVNSLGEDVLEVDIQDLAEANLNRPGNTLYHSSFGVRVTWDYSLTPPNEAAYTSRFPEMINVDPYDFFSLRVCQRFNQSFNPRNEFQDFDVALVDHKGESASVSLSEFGGIPYPYSPRFAGVPVKSVMRSFRIPLSRFVVSNPNLDLESLAEVSLFFVRTQSGRIFMDSLEFTK